MLVVSTYSSLRFRNVVVFTAAGYYLLVALSFSFINYDVIIRDRNPSHDE